MTRLRRILLVSGLLVISAIAAASAGAEDGELIDPANPYDVYLPWVSHGVALDESGEFYATVVIQNMEHLPVDLEVYAGVGGPQAVEAFRDWDLRRSITLSPFETVTYDAVDLHIPPGHGVSVRARARIAAVDENADAVDGVADLAGAPARIGAIVKSAGPILGSSAVTTRYHQRVDGYSGLAATDYQSSSGAYVLPIVQNNNGWRTTVRLAHLGSISTHGEGPAEVEVRLSTAGAAPDDPAVESVTFELWPGQVETFDLTEVLQQEDWVGSAVIRADVPLGAVAERSKITDRMFVTNVSRPEQVVETIQYAPLVFRNYNDWNTGISIANTDPERENVMNVVYYGPSMEEVGSEAITIPPGGMNFIHSPGEASEEFGEGFVGSAQLTGTTSFHAVVDQIKYVDGQPDVGQAMSYVLEALPASYTTLPKPGEAETELWDQSSTMLSLPLVQRGDPENPGAGDISGIQLFNTSSDHAIRLEIMFYDESGKAVPPTVSNGRPSPLLTTLGSHQSLTLYTPSLDGFPEGFHGSAIITVVGGNGGVVGISNNVNYDVRGDGSSAFSLIHVAPSELPGTE